MPCELCTDPDGVACFPLYGLGAHEHRPGGGTILHPAQPLPGFTPNPGEPGMGWHWCPACGDGRIYALERLAEAGLTTNIKLDMRGAFDAGEKGHPQKIMRQLGAYYEVAETHPIADVWLLFGCTNLPDPLPSYLSRMK